MRTLEARLHALHMEQSELQAKRAQVQQMRAGLDGGVVSGKGGRAQAQVGSESPLKNFRAVLPRVYLWLKQRP